MMHVDMLLCTLLNGSFFFLLTTHMLEADPLYSCNLGSSQSQPSKQFVKIPFGEFSVLPISLIVSKFPSISFDLTLRLLEQKAS